MLTSYASNDLLRSTLKKMSRSSGLPLCQVVRNILVWTNWRKQFLFAYLRMRVNTLDFSCLCQDHQECNPNLWEATERQRGSVLRKKLCWSLTPNRKTNLRGIQSKTQITKRRKCIGVWRMSESSQSRPASKICPV